MILPISCPEVFKVFKVFFFFFFLKSSLSLILSVLYRSGYEKVEQTGVGEW